MAQRMMWDVIGREYRGQASDGTVVAVNQEAMDIAHKKAGKTVYDSDWWVETMDPVLVSWGIHGKHWLDDATRTRRAQFTTEKQPDLPPAPKHPNVTSPLGSGPLLSRISGRLSPRDLGEDKSGK